MASKLEEVKAQMDAIPGWMKIFVGIAGLLISWKLFPIVELLNLFALIVLVPLCLFASGWLIADGAGAAVLSTWNSTMEKAREEAAKMAAS
jgi:hypothetical protein